MLQGGKRTLRSAIARFLHATGVLQARRRPDRLIVVTFHRVLDEAERRAYPLPGLAVTEAELRWILLQLRHHYSCDTITASVARWRAPRSADLPPLAVTFDDCTADNHARARPILEELGIRASFFAPAQLIETGEALWHDRMGFAVQSLARTGSVAADRLVGWLTAHGFPPEAPAGLPHQIVRWAKDLAPEDRARHVAELEELAGGRQDPEWARIMSWSELREMAVIGHEVGSHSMTHELLPKLEAGALAHEVGGSRELLEARLSREIGSFCYPNGDESPAVVEAVRAAGYRVAVTTAGGLNETGADALRLRRFDMRLDYVTDGWGTPLDALLLFRISGLHPGANP